MKITSLDSVELKSKKTPKSKAKKSKSKDTDKAKVKKSKDTDKAKKSKSKDRVKKSKDKDAKKSSRTKDKLKSKTTKTKKLSDKPSKKLLQRAEAKKSSLDSMASTVEDLKSDVTIRESEQFKEYYEMFNSLKDIARSFEKRCKEGGQSKDVYALLKTYDQMREVIADIRALRDIAGVAELLRDEVIDPLVQVVLNEIVQLNQSVKQHVLKVIQGNDALSIIEKLNEICANVGDSLNDAYGNAIESTQEVLEQQ